MKKLIVPVYLNQRIVFDMMAMMNDGLSTVTSVIQTESDNTSSQSEVASAIGTGGILSSLFKIGISGGTTRSGSQDSGKVFSGERVHTPASLFYQLRNMMIEENLVTHLENRSAVPGNFVEIECQLNRNPIIETLEMFSELGNLFTKITDQSPQHPKKRKKGERGNRHNINIQQDNNGLLDSENMEILFAIVKEALKLLKVGDTIDLVGYEISDEFSAVITLETGFLNDPLMSDLVDGQFKVLGVITRSISDDSESVNLLRKTTISKLPPEIVDSFLEALSGLRDELNFDLSPLDIEIRSPVIQILPVAIFA